MMKKYLFILCTLISTSVSSEFSKPPVLMPFSDDYWMLVEDFSYKINNHTIVIPAGFVTDLASVPDLAKVIYDKYGRYAPAGIIHDYLYWNQPCERKEADKILKEALKESGSGYWARNSIKRAVKHLGGEEAWKENNKWRKKGKPRIISEAQRNFGVGTKWKDYVKTLTNKPAKKGERAGFCEI